jgi:hypothetical protein
MLEKFAFLSAVVMLPFIPKGPIRGDRAYEPRLPSLNLALVPVDPVARPTMPVSPQPDVALVPVKTGSDRMFPVDPKRPKPPANTQEFVNWLARIEEFGELTQRRLLSLYAEFCDDRYEPVSTRRLLLQIGSCGVEKRRASPKIVNGKSQRLRVYWIPRQSTPLRAVA